MSAQGIRFETADHYSTGEMQAHIEVADLNSDGRLDIVLGTFTGITAMLGGQAGRFGPALSRRSGEQRYGLAVADFDGDGRPDAAQLKEDGIALVQRGAGNGRFLSPTTFVTGSAVGYLATGDFNGDGRPDLATASQQTGRLHVHLNQGGGVFAPGIERNVGQVMNGITAGDLNHDGRSDLVVAHSSYLFSASTVLLAEPGGAFVDGPSLSLVGARAVTLKDVNADGHADILAPYLESDQVAVHLGDGTGAFSSAVFVSAPGWPIQVAVGDVDGDDKADLVVSAFKSSGMSVFLGGGDGTFAAGGTWGASTNPTGIVVGDFDGDNLLDAAVANGNAPEVSVLRGGGDGRFRGVRLTEVPELYPLSVAAGDLNADDRTDLVVPTLLGTAVLSGQQESGFSSPRTIRSIATRSVALGRFDDENGPDLAFSNGPTGAAGVALGDGAGSFLRPVTTVLGLTPGPGEIGIGDLNQDGLDDLVVPRHGADDLAVLISAGAGQFMPAIFHPVGDRPNAAAIGDFDGDGHMDVAVANAGSNDISLLRGSAEEGLGQESRYGTGGLAPVRLAVLHLDRNARADLVVINSNSGNLTVFAGAPDGLRRIRVVPAGTNPVGLAVGDLDGDLLQDLVVVDDYSSRAFVFRGSGGGNFVPSLSMPSVRGAPAIGDFDGDHRPDLAVTSNNEVWMFRNVTPMADLGVTVSDGMETLVPGGSATYVVEVRNRGPEAVADARLMLKWPRSLGAATWSCTATSGATCPVGGVAPIDRNVSLDPGSSLSLTLTTPAILPGATCAKVTASIYSRRLRDQNPADDKAIDVAGVAPALSVRAAQVLEPSSGTRTLRFLVTLDRSTCHEVRVEYATSDASAGAGQDYDAASGTLTFAPGVKQRFVDVVVHADEAVEGQESFVLTLQNPSAATLAVDQGTGTIVDNES